MQRSLRPQDAFLLNALATLSCNLTYTPFSSTPDHKHTQFPFHAVALEFIFGWATSEDRFFCTFNCSKGNGFAFSSTSLSSPRWSQQTLLTCAWLSAFCARVAVSQPSQLLHIWDRESPRPPDQIRSFIGATELTLARNCRHEGRVF